MRIAFVTPTLHTLGPNWRRDPQVVKLAAPTLSGALRSQGYTDLRQYDFEVQVFALEERQPGLLNLRAFFDDAPVDAYMRGEPGTEVEAQVELILDALEIDEADLFAFTCASTIGIYADMHADSNICVALAYGLRKRFPACRSMLGGMQISPDSLQREEYIKLLERCPALDFTAEGQGELPMLQVLAHLTGEEPLVEVPRVLRVAQGYHLLRGSAPRARLPKEFAMRDKQLDKKFETPDLEAPEGDHPRAALENISIRITPWFDPKNIDLRKIRGGDLLDRYHLGPEWHARLAPHLDDRVAVLPYIFVEGCNARCAFCSYSTTSMEKQDIDQVIRSLHWMVETYGVRYFHFLNTNINGSLKYAEAFCDAIIESGLDILWSDCANLWALNERLMDKLRRSGCIRLTFGLECPSPRMLKYLLKGIDIETAHERLEYLDKLGIWNHLLLITGLPTETEEDARHFVDFLERSRDYVHGYSISSFYLISSSLMGQFPERFQIAPRRNLETGLLEDAAFDEIGGLKWEEKEKQIVYSTQRIQKAISALKLDPKYTSGSIDLELLFWLYDRLGHENKADVVRCYESAFLDTPNHTRYLAGPLRELITSPTLSRPFAEKGLSVKRDAIRFDGSDVVMPLTGASSEVELRLAIVDDDAPRGGAVAAGHRIVVRSTQPSTLQSLAPRLYAPTSPLVRFLASNGWNLTDGATRPGATRFTDGHATAEVVFVPLLAGAQAFLAGERYAMNYAIVDGSVADPPRVARLFRLFGEKALQLLDQAESGAIHPQTVEAVAATLVEELEAPFRPLWASAPNFEGFRHGDRFSRVAPAPPLPAE